MVLLGMVIGRCDRPRTNISQENGGGGECFEEDTKHIQCIMHSILTKTYPPSLSRSKYIAHARLARKIFTDLYTEFARVVKCCVLYVIVLFYFHILKFVIIVVELAWMEV